MGIATAWAIALFACAVASVAVLAATRARRQREREQREWERRFAALPTNLIRADSQLRVVATSASCRARLRERVPGIPAGESWAGHSPADLGYDVAALCALLREDAAVASGTFDLDTGRVEVRAVRVGDEHIAVWDWAPSLLEDQQACVGAALEEFPLPVILVDEAGQVTQANRSARAELAAPGALAGHVEDLFGEALPAPAFATENSLTLGGRTRPVTCQPLRGRDGVRRGQLLVWSPEQLPAGRAAAAPSPRPDAPNGEGAEASGANA